jgi:hypothetical protein
MDHFEIDTETITAFTELDEHVCRPFGPRLGRGLIDVEYAKLR